jgi:hypothetical protein
MASLQNKKYYELHFRPTETTKLIRGPNFKFKLVPGTRSRGRLPVAAVCGTGHYSLSAAHLRLFAWPGALVRRGSRVPCRRPPCHSCGLTAKCVKISAPTESVASQEYLKLLIAAHKVDPTTSV